MRQEGVVLFSGIVPSVATIDYEVPHFIVPLNAYIEIKKMTAVNIDSVHQHLSVFVLRRQEKITSGGSNVLINEATVNHGENTIINILDNHLLLPNDRLFFNASIADKVILNMTGIAFSE